MDISRVDILTEVAMLSYHMTLPRYGHLEQVLHIFGYCKYHKKSRLMFYCGYSHFKANPFKEYGGRYFTRIQKKTSLQICQLHLESQYKSHYLWIQIMVVISSIGKAEQEFLFL